MKKATEKLLRFTAKVCEKAAVKSCSKTSGYDAYQPKVPEAVRVLAQKNK